MQNNTYANITYRDQTFTLLTTGLGGTRQGPKLKPADELLLDWLHEQTQDGASGQVAIYHDRTGVLCTCAPASQKAFFSNNMLHHRQLLENFDRNKLTEPPPNGDLLEAAATPAKIILLQVPKSLELFELYLHHIALTAGPDTRVAAAFQTRHFTPKLLEISARYAGEVNQSRAHKKARLLLLTGFKTAPTAALTRQTSTYGDVIYEQYAGVFSASHIDYATQFMLDEWATNDLLAELPAPQTILDCGSGNGIIGDYLLGRYPEAHLTAYDVSRMAVASTEYNLTTHEYADRATVLLAAAIGEIKEPARFDLIVTNPPFHVEHQTDIGVSLRIFEEATGRLAAGGHLVVVANRHLNYLTHLRRNFDEVLTVAENEKFILYRCC
jgi:16S rRNA G1207 methylase RsmC